MGDLSSKAPLVLAFVVACGGGGEVQDEESSLWSGRGSRESAPGGSAGATVAGSNAIAGAGGAIAAAGHGGSIAGAGGSIAGAAGTGGSIAGAGGSIAGAAGAGGSIAGAAGTGGSIAGASGTVAGGFGGDGGFGGSMTLSAPIHCWSGEAQGVDPDGGDNATAFSGVTYAPDGSNTVYDCGTLSGDNTGVEVANAPSLAPTDPWTFDLWVEPIATLPNDLWVLDRTGSGATVVSVHANDDASPWTWSVRSSGGTMAPSTLALPLPPKNQWTHLALTWDGATLVAYGNGLQSATLDGTALEGGTLFDIAAPRWCSHNGTPGTQGFGGRIEAVRIWKRALASTEIAAIAAGPKSNCEP